MPSPLTATHPLDARSTTIGETTLSVVTDRPIYSLSIPLGEDSAFDEALSTTLKVSLPAPGAYHDHGDHRICGLARDQFFLISRSDQQPEASALAQRLDGQAYVTDQSDSWIMLSLTGPMAVAAMERISPIEVSENAFPAGRLARTAMEHLSAIVISEEGAAFTLLSPLSSAESFWHAVKTSLQNVSS